MGSNKTTSAARPSQAKSGIKGLRTVIYPAPDLKKGRNWYAEVLGRQPYFDEPFYVGFTVGGFELGLIPDGTPSESGAQAYWGVPNAAAELDRLTKLGAQVVEPVKEVGGGIKVAGVRDPFGNVFRVIENPHFSAKSVE